MRHLCDKCESSLEIPKFGSPVWLEDQTDGQSHQETGKIRIALQNNIPTVPFLSTPFQSSLQALEASANNVNGKACHFCLLIPCSLKGRSSPDYDPSSRRKEGCLNLVFRRGKEVQLPGQIEVWFELISGTKRAKIPDATVSEIRGKERVEYGYPISDATNLDPF